MEGDLLDTGLRDVPTVLVHRGVEVSNVNAREACEQTLEFPPWMVSW